MAQRQTFLDDAGEQCLLLVDREQRENAFEEFCARGGTAIVMLRECDTDLRQQAIRVERVREPAKITRGQGFETFQLAHRRHRRRMPAKGGFLDDRPRRQQTRFIEERVGFI